MFEADYNDNVITVVHVAGCRHRPKGKARKPLSAQMLPDALTEARYQGLTPSEATDMGDAVPAPCTR